MATGVIDTSCSKCGGMMFLTTLQDMGSTYTDIQVEAWRCFSCGKIIDPVIAKHQNASQNGTQTEMRKVNKNRKSLIADLKKYDIAS